MARSTGAHGLGLGLGLIHGRLLDEGDACLCVADKTRGVRLLDVYRGGVRY